MCRVTLGKPVEQYNAIKIAHAPPGHHSVIGRPSAGGLNYPEYAIYRGEQVCGIPCNKKMWQSGLAYACYHASSKKLAQNNTDYAPALPNTGLGVFEANNNIQFELHAYSDAVYV